jgi:hypothetical protein
MAVCTTWMLHYCPVIAGTKLTNVMLAEMEKNRIPKTPGATRFPQSAVPLQDFSSLHRCATLAPLEGWCFSKVIE